MQKLENLLMVIHPIYLKTKLVVDLCNRQAHILELNRGGRKSFKKTQRKTLTLLVLEESLDVQSV